MAEFKKRGLSHAHFLIILKTNAKLTAHESFDKIVCAEIPNRDENESLHLVVARHMIHGPFGPLKLNNICMKKEMVHVEMVTQSPFAPKLTKEKIVIQNIEDVMMVEK